MFLETFFLKPQEMAGVQCGQAEERTGGGGGGMQSNLSQNSSPGRHLDHHCTFAGIALV